MIARRLGILAATLAGCAVGPDYEVPHLDAPSAWHGARAGLTEAERADLAAWWSAFGDPRLDALVERAIASNPDLRIAAARVREARAQLGVATGALLPEAAASGSYERSRASENGTRSLTPFPIDEKTSLYRAGFDAGWEIDLFGGVRRTIEAASAEAGAAEEDLRSVRVTLLGDVARNYVELRGAQRQRALQQESLRAARETVALSRSRFQAGVATDLDVARAEALAATVGAQLPPLEAACARAVHRLGVLLGQAPSALQEELAAEAPVPVPPARILVGVPSDLLFRRPDVRAAERRLAAATARVGAATADFFPRISLTGAFGVESLDSEDLFRSASRTWAFGPAIRWPIFSGGRIRANIRVQDERQAQAHAGLEKAFLGALEEVENALVGFFQEHERRRSLQEAAAANRRAVDLAGELHRRGLVSFLDVLDAQRGMYESQRLAAQADASVAAAGVALYKALGGGWELR